MPLGAGAVCSLGAATLPEAYSCQLGSATLAQASLSSRLSHPEPSWQAHVAWCWAAAAGRTASWHPHGGSGSFWAEPGPRLCLLPPCFAPALSNPAGHPDLANARSIHGPQCPVALTVQLGREQHRLPGSSCRTPTRCPALLHLRLGRARCVAARARALLRLRGGSWLMALSPRLCQACGCLARALSSGAPCPGGVPSRRPGTSHHLPAAAWLQHRLPGLAGRDLHSCGAFSEPALACRSRRSCLSRKGGARKWDLLSRVSERDALIGSRGPAVPGAELGPLLSHCGLFCSGNQSGRSLPALPLPLPPSCPQSTAAAAGTCSLSLACAGAASPAEPWPGQGRAGPGTRWLGSVRATVSDQVGVRALPWLCHPPRELCLPGSAASREGLANSPNPPGNQSGRCRIIAALAAGAAVWGRP